MSKSRIIGQTSLIEPEKLYETQVVSSLDGYDVLSRYGSEGSYVSVVDRAQHLIAALNAISQRNIRDGIALAAYTEEYSAPIWANYRSATPNVLDGASNNRNIFQKELRENFWRATGFAALRGSKLMPEAQINPRAQKMWRDFNEAYAHPKKIKERNAYKRSLQKQLASIEHLSDLAA